MNPELKANNRKKPRKKRITIGCLLGRYEDSYQNKICSGLSDFAEENDINLIFYAGRPLKMPTAGEALCNVIFDLVNPHIIDGLVIIAGSICQFSNFEEFNKFIQKYQGFPYISVGLEVPDQSCILVENQNGMKEAISHLILHHDLRRIAFIQGTRGHPEAESRFIAYTQVSEENGIPIDLNLVIPGNFTAKSGSEAIQILINERKVAFDAIVAVNDPAAMSAIFTLRERGISVPDEIAIIGFDDVPVSEGINPPLTTVRQPLYQVGETAGQLLLMKLKGQEFPRCTICPTELVVRKSCGCTSSTLLNTGTSENVSLTSSVHFFNNFRKKLLKS